jgi:UDP-2,3-diacylglucosamine pyrophosphatase LpxH
VSAALPQAAPPQAPRRLRAVFLSDLHLGYKGADIAALTDFLGGCDFDQLYLVGDILDGWKLEKRWHWTQDYCDFLDLLTTLRQRRVRITLVTGNHDEKLRDILPVVLRPLILRRFGIRIEERCLHRTRDGRRLLVMHGDQFDGVLWRGTSKTADRLWSWLTERGLMRPPRPVTLHKGRLRRWSLGRAIAREGGALGERYCAAALRRVIRDGADGIVFGHSHVPLLERRQGRWLANCGSWTGSAMSGGHSLIVERCDGGLELLRWPTQPATSAAAPCPPGRLRIRHSETALIMRYVHALWRPGSPAPPRPRTAPAAPPAAVLLPNRPGAVA